ncbi:MAG: hypothetical protein ACTS8S_00855 [Giesbergeria sp.]
MSELDDAFERITHPPFDEELHASELPTPKLPERDSVRDTERPSAEVLAALQYVSRTGVGWVEQPRWSYDVELDCCTLTETFIATAVDQHNNRFVVSCPPGLAIAVPETGGARAFLRCLTVELVKAQLLREPFAVIYPFNGGPELHVDVDVGWLTTILDAFRKQNPHF